MSTGKSVVITGGSRGIGAATAELAAARGWAVAISYLGNDEAAARTLAAVERAGAKGIAVKGDVSEEADVIALFDAAVRAFGAIDGVVNNAGIIVPPPQPLADMSVARLRKIIDVNFLGAYLCAREAVRRMARSRGGRGGAIVNMSSAAARLGAARERVDYAGTKGAIESLTVGLAKEVAEDGIRVNAVRPGLIDTDIHASAGTVGDIADRASAAVPMKRPGTSQEVAEAVLWLLSEQSSYVTGTILDVTGGR